MKYQVNCAYYGASNSTAIDVTQQLKDLFLLHENDPFFSVLVDWTTLGLSNDPAEGTVKSLVVEYICVESGVTIIKSGIDGETIDFSAEGNGITIYEAIYSSKYNSMDLRLALQSYVSEANGATHFEVGSAFFVDRFCLGSTFDSGLTKTLMIRYTIDKSPIVVLVASDGQEVELLTSEEE